MLVSNAEILHEETESESWCWYGNGVLRVHVCRDVEDYEKKTEAGL